MNKTPPHGYVKIAGGGPDDDGFAADSRSGKMRVVASWGEGWEHVSVSHRERCPTWEEMEAIARHFWPDQTAMQLHVPASDHINAHPYCLHWWRPIGGEIPRPPGWMVGPEKTPANRNPLSFT